MITPSYSPTATERVLPRMALDFTTGVLDPRVTVARLLNTATRFNASGLVEIVNANLPRFDYDSFTLAPKGLLIEETRANLLLYSDQLNVASWGKTASVTADQLVSPDGTTNADLVSTTGNFQYVRQSITATANAAYTQSFFVKPVSGSTTVRILLTNGPQTEAAGSNFSLTGAGSLGTLFQVGTGVLTGRSITRLANGWYLCTISGTVNTTTLFGYIDNHSNGTMSFGAWGAQLEAGAFATSYIPTTTTSLTRNADTVSMTGTNFSDWYNQTSGTFVIDADSYTIGSADYPLTASDGTSNNRFGFYRTAANIAGYVTTGAVDQMYLTRGSITANTPYKAAVAAIANSGNVALNGTAAAGDASLTMPTLNRLNIGNNNSAGFMSGHMRKIAYYSPRLLNAELQAFSK